MKQVYSAAEKEVGTWEWAEGSNPKIDQFFVEAGHPDMKNDVSWCAAFVGAMLKRCGLKGTGSLAARSYQEWGEPVELDRAHPGDIVVFWRGERNGWQGHVGFYADHDARQILVLGGNQRDQVNVSPYSRDRLLAVRRAEGAEAKPAPSKPTKREFGGVISLIIGGVLALAAFLGLRG